MKKLVFFLMLLEVTWIVQASPQINLLFDSRDSTKFEIEWDTPSFEEIAGDTVIISLPDCGPRGEQNGPMLVGRTFNVAVPRDATVTIEVQNINWSKWIHKIPIPKCYITGKNCSADLSLFNQPVNYEGKIVYDQIWRGVRVVGVDVVPFEYSPNKGIRYAKKTLIKVLHPGKQPVYNIRLYHPDMGKLYKSTLVNPNAAIPDVEFSIAEWNPDSGAELLVITTSEFYEHALPWINWKLLMGMPTIVVLADTIGDSVDEIKNFVSNAYHNWDIPPIYLLIIGDTEQIPTHTDYTYIINDLWYCMVDGDDIFPDILPGRISVDDQSQLDVFVTKLMNYEANPDTVDKWFLRGIGVVRRDDCSYLGPVDSSYCAAVFYAMEACSLAGFYSTPVFVNCDGVAGITDYFDEGANLVTYRGQAVRDWWDPFGDLTTRPSGKSLPIYVSITCATGSFHLDNYPCEYVTRAGSVENPRGGVAWIGQGRCSSNSLERSSLSKNIFVGWFEADLPTLELAHQYGRTAMYSEFGGSNAARIEYQSSGLVGSPEMQVWRGDIKVPDVHITEPLPYGPHIFSVQVFREGYPLQDARVSLHQGDRFSYGITDASGVVNISFEILATTDPVYITVTGPNIYPYIDTLTTAELHIVLNSLPVEYIDLTGDRDGLPNPGELIALIPHLTNTGDSTSPPLSGTITIADSLIDLIDSTTAFPSISPGDTVEGDTIKFLISPDHPSDTIQLTLHLSSPSDSLNWYFLLQPLLTIHRFQISNYSFEIIDTFLQDNADGVQNNGEQVLVSLHLENNTMADCFNLSAKIIDTSFADSEYVPAIIGNDSIYIGDLLRDTVINSSEVFILNLMANTEAVFDSITIPIALHGEAPLYTFDDTIGLIIAPHPVQDSITGPDEYGYYILDNLDLHYTNHPVYTWNDISEIGTLITALTDADDAKTRLELPFPFRYYGEEYDSLTISSNGWLSIFDISLPSSPITFPLEDSFNGIIAPFWSDMNPAEQGDIYCYYDSTAGKLIIQYDNVGFYYTTGIITFQVVIYDTISHPTPSGDNEIDIYFNRVIPLLDRYAIGIENADGTSGLLYMSSSIDHGTGGVPPDSGLAIRISTRPSYEAYPWIIFYSGPQFDDLVGDNDSLFESGELLEVKFSVKNAGYSGIDSLIALINATPEIEPYGDTVFLGTLNIGEVKDNYSHPLRFRLRDCSPGERVLVPIKFVDLKTGYTAVLVRYILVNPSGINEKFTELPENNSIIIAPNPANAAVTIKVKSPYIKSKTRYLAKIFDIRGNTVATIPVCARSDGELTVKFDAENLNSGIYFVRISIADHIYNSRLILIK